ncbi:MAG: HD domain-containing protein [Thermodesulfobacteriota bacterium]
MTVLDNYELLINKFSRRKEEGIIFDTFLREQTSWITSPASTRFHLAYEGGLLAHSVNVASTLLQLRQILAPDIEEESCIIAGLFHDVGKVGMPDQPYYMPNPSKWHVKNKGINYIINQNLVHLDIATRSLFLVAQYIPLSDEEAQAIRYHDGQYINENVSVAHKETRLTRLLQYADNWSGGVLED